MRWHLNWRVGLGTWVCLHYWVVIWVAGNLGCWKFLIPPYIAQFMGCVISLLLPTIIIMRQECSQALNICKCLWSLYCGGVSDMMLVPLITFHCHYYIWGCMCSTGPFPIRWLRGYIHSSCYYHHQIGSINLTHSYPIFPWLCAWEVCCIIFCHLLHIHSGKTGILFSVLLYSLWCVQRVRYVLACWSCSFVCTLHHLIIIIVQIYLKTSNL